MAAFPSFLRRFTTSFHNLFNLNDNFKKINVEIRKYAKAIKPGRRTCNRYVQCIKWTFNDKKDRSESDEKNAAAFKLHGINNQPEVRLVLAHVASRISSSPSIRHLASSPGSFYRRFFLHIGPYKYKTSAKRQSSKPANVA